jgi:predicted secreted protein
MNTTLTFRKESIQQSSNMSAALSRPSDAQGPRPARDQQLISLSTLLTITQG